MTRLSAPIFDFGENKHLPVTDSHTRSDFPEGLLALTGPSAVAEEDHLPVRGDLAHIKLAGRYFVPHYAVPMPHKVKALVSLRAAARPDAEQICELPAGDGFDVLDITGGWAWGQYGEDGPVGYVPMSNLQAS
ncbi:MAG: SH3 domain-containing protein [Novosphingobium sp.]|nr:SH3 domain-containing protein [Novosphingobium sp.]